MQQEEQTKQDTGPDVPFWEWALVFMAALGTDVGLFLLDNVLVIGLGISWFCDLSFGMTFNFWRWYRGLKTTMLTGIIQGAFLTFLTAGDGELPFWWLDVVLMYFSYKAEKKIRNIPLAGKALDAANKMQGAVPQVSNLDKAA